MKKNILLLIIIPVLFVLTSCTKGREISDSGNLVRKTVVEDPSLPAINILGVKLHSEAFGNPDSPLVIILHGGPGSDYRYMLRCKAFADSGYRVVFYDQRGSGLSQRLPKSSYTDTEIMIEELLGVIQFYKTSNTRHVFLLGDSWGGILASGFVNKYPSAISGIAMIEPGGLVWADIKEYISKSIDFSLFSETLNDATYIDQFIAADENDHNVLDYKFGLMSSGNEVVGELPELTWRSGAIVRDALFDLGEKSQIDWTKNLKNYPARVLFMYTEKNRAYGKAWAERVSNPFAQVQLVFVQGVGHSPLGHDLGWNLASPSIFNYFKSLK